MRKQKLLMAGLLVAASSFAGVSYAQGGWMGGKMDTNFYVGGNIGQSVFRKSCDNVPVSCDDKDMGWRVYGGYQFHRNIAVEAGYFDLGEASLRGTFGGVPVSAKAEVRGWEVLGVGILPINDAISIFGKLGVAFSRVKLSGPGGSLSDNSTDVTFGVGGQYRFTSNLAARLEWQRYDSVGGNTTGKDDVDLFSVGLQFRF